MSKAAGTRRKPRCSSATIRRWPPIYRDSGRADALYPAYPAARGGIAKEGHNTELDDTDIRHTSNRLLQAGAE